MRARVVEFSAQQGFGRVELADGQRLVFDATVCGGGIPAVGREVEVEVGEGLRGPRVKSLSAIPTGATRVMKGVLAAWGDSSECVCLDEATGAPTRVRFQHAAWSGPLIPKQGQAVACTLSDEQWAVPSRGYLARMALEVEPIADDALASELLASLRARLTIEDKQSFRELTRRPEKVHPIERKPTAQPHLCDGGKALDRRKKNVRASCAGSDPAERPSPPPTAARSALPVMRA